MNRGRYQNRLEVRMPLFLGKLDACVWFVSGDLKDFHLQTYREAKNS